MLAEKLGLDRARVSHSQRARRRSTDGDGAGARRRRRHPRSASRRCARIGSARAPRRRSNSTANERKLARGVGIAGMWYGCGNTSLPTRRPSASASSRDGRIVAASGRRRYRPGLQHRHHADRRRCPRRCRSLFDLVSADTDLTPDCGKTSASRQTFVTGKAAELAGAGAARSRFCGSPMPATTRRIAARRIGTLVVRDDDRRARRIDLGSCRTSDFGYVLDGGGNLRSADHAARRRRPGRPLRHLRLRRAYGRSRGRHASSARSRC